MHRGRCAEKAYFGRVIHLVVFSLLLGRRCFANTPSDNNLARLHDLQFAARGVVHADVVVEQAIFASLSFFKAGVVDFRVG